MWGIKMFFNGTETANHSFITSHKSGKGSDLLSNADGRLPLDFSALLLIKEGLKSIHRTDNDATIKVIIEDGKKYVLQQATFTLLGSLRVSCAFYTQP